MTERPLMGKQAATPTFMKFSLLLAQTTYEDTPWCTSDNNEVSLIEIVVPRDMAQKVCQVLHTRAEFLPKMKLQFQQF